MRSANAISSARQPHTFSPLRCRPSLNRASLHACKRPVELFRERGSATLVAGAAGILILAAATFAYFQFRAPAGRSASSGRVPVVTAERKPFVRILRLSGTTSALHSRPILAPRLAGAQVGSMVITGLAPAGARVKQGDMLVEFDRQAQYKDFLDKQAAYEDLVDKLAEKQAAEDAARAKDDTDLKQAEDALATAKLELKKKEIESRIDAEKAQEQFEEATATLAQLRKTYALKRQAAAADIQAQKILLDRARQTMQYAQTNAQKMVVRSPMDGVVVLNTTWLNGRMGQVEPGSQVRPGLPFMRVVDPSEMDVRVLAGQADVLFLRVGQKAEIHLDAYPGLSFPGTLEEISPLGYPGQFSDAVRNFAVVFSIQGSNPRLMPDLSAAVDVELAKEPNALVVPVQSVESDKSGSFVWLRSGSGFQKRQVQTGPENDLEIVIVSGLQAGDEIRENAPMPAAAGAGT